MTISISLDPMESPRILFHTIKCDRRAPFAPGVGLPALMLCLFTAAGFARLCLFKPPAMMLCGRVFTAVPFARACLCPFGFGVA